MIARVRRSVLHAGRSPGLLVFVAFSACFTASNHASAQATMLTCPIAPENLSDGIQPDFSSLDDGSISVPVNNPAIFPNGIRFATSHALNPSPGAPWHLIYINTNGNLSFGQGYTVYTPTALPGLSQPTIAPYFGDFDFNYATAPGVINGDAYLCQDTINHQLIVTWDNILHFNATASTTVNAGTLQVILRDAPNVCANIPGLEVEFRYGNIAWHAGQASVSGPDGLCVPGSIGVTCFPAVAGFDLGYAATGYQIPSSGTGTVQSDLATSSNVGDPGVWRFSIPDGGGLQICGDGIQTVCEACDDGNTDSNDACLGTCVLASCGDGFVQTGVEVCDDGNLTDGDGCDSDCTETGCGNGKVNVGEQCDDGNVTSGDGCDSNCTVTACGNGIVTIGEVCDDGNVTSGDGCDSNCTVTACGNGIVTIGEACDDGNVTSGDGCDSNCTVTGCGNGILTMGEACDDGNVTSGDGCGAACQLEAACTHGICVTGVALTSGCDPCVTQVCGVDAFCCSNSWDAICVNEVVSICGLNCTPPDTSIPVFEPNPSNDPTGEFVFASTEPSSTFECQIDGSGFVPCPENFTTPSLAEGAHTLEVFAINTAGNADLTPATYTWVVDTTPPDTSIPGFEPNPSNDPTGEFVFASMEPGSTFECRIDGAAFAPCPQNFTTPSLADGPHTLEVFAIDPAGNADPKLASYTWVVDTTSPDTSIPVFEPNPSNDPTGEFVFASTEPGSTFECRIDGAAFAPCPQNFTTSSLADGLHTLEVRAIDSLGNADSTPASSSWNVDTTPPDTSIPVFEPNPSNDPTGEFVFASMEPGSTFECRIDGAAFAPCPQNFTTSSLADGLHTLEVRAIDSLGNADPTPASSSWNVDTTPPDTSIPVAEPNLTNDPTGEFVFASTEPSSTFECQIDGSGFVPCSENFTTPSLADGPHTLEVRAIDSLGNADPTPASYAWVVESPTCTEGAPCDDNNACTQSDTCQSGTCTGSNPVVCSPKNECEEAGTCDPASGKCIQVLKPDNTPCQSNGSCVAGECLLTCATVDDCRPDPKFFDCVENHCVPHIEGPLDSQCACRIPGAPSPSSEYSGVWMLLGLSLLAQRRRSRRASIAYWK